VEPDGQPAEHQHDHAREHQQRRHLAEPQLRIDHCHDHRRHEGAGSDENLQGTRHRRNVIGEEKHQQRTDVDQ